MKEGGSSGTAGGLKLGLVGEEAGLQLQTEERGMGCVLPVPLQYSSSGNLFPPDVFVYLFLLISKGLSVLGPITAGGPDANSTITVSFIAEIPHKRRKPKGFLLWNTGLKNWLLLNGGLQESGSQAEAGTREGRWDGTGAHPGSGEPDFAGGGISSQEAFEVPICLS